LIFSAIRLENDKTCGVQISGGVPNKNCESPKIFEFQMFSGIFIFAFIH